MNISSITKPYALPKVKNYALSFNAELSSYNKKIENTGDSAQQRVYAIHSDNLSQGTEFIKNTVENAKNNFIEQSLPVLTETPTPIESLNTEELQQLKTLDSSEKGLSSNLSSAIEGLKAASNTEEALSLQPSRAIEDLRASFDTVEARGLN